MDKAQVRLFINSRIKLILFMLGSIFSIFFILLYVIKYIEEEKLIFVAKEQLYVCIFLFSVIICLGIGIFIALMLVKVAKQNSILKQQNNALKESLESVEKLVVKLFNKTVLSEDNFNHKIQLIEDVLSDKIDFVEDEILRSNRENESTMLKLFKVK